MNRSEAALPPPDADALAHSRTLATLIQARANAAPLAFFEYMRAALYEPGHGYYMGGAARFGSGGDFITAPELSPLFGAALARQCQELFAGDAGLPMHILELGAGSGALAESLLDASDPSLRYAILEPSPVLQQQQRERLLDALGESVLARITWLDALPARFDGIVIANEVVDAMPVERFVKRSDTPGDAWRVMTVPGEEAESPFADAQGEPDAAWRAALAHIECELAAPLPAGYASELNLLAGPWLRTLADMLGRGAVLVADYGYPRAELYSAERGGGTLACYYRHRAHGDPYRWPGLQDITAHVDFTTLAEAGTAAGLSLLGYTAQGSFLLGNGLTDLAEQRLAVCERELDRIATVQQVKTLTLPGEMGERFQVIAFGSDYDRALRGFAERDLTHRL